MEVILMQDVPNLGRIGELGNVRHMDASHAKAVLGWQPRPARETIVDTANSLIAHGVVKV